MIRVMIVEDEPHAQRRLQRMIERLDDFFRIEATAMDGEEALDILKTTRCDVVFTDIRMPIMDGVELMQRVRRQYPEMMLVVLSGYSDFSYVSEAVRSQAVDYLLKPLTEEALRGCSSTQGTLSGAGTRTDPPQTGRAHQQGRPAQRRRKRADERLGAFLLCAGALPICESRKCAPGRNSGAAGRCAKPPRKPSMNCLPSTGNLWAIRPRSALSSSAPTWALPQIAAFCMRGISRSDMPVSASATGNRSLWRRSTAPSGAAQGTRAAGAHRREPFSNARRPWRPRGDEEALRRPTA